MKTSLRHSRYSGFGTWCVAAMLFAATGLSVARADENEKAKPAAEQKPTALTHPQSPALWDVDTMMEQAVQQISKRYSLNEQQQQYTRLFLTHRVREFLDKHENEVRELLQESMDMRTGNAPSDRAALQIWASRAIPLYQEATQAIIDGNEEWGAILNEDQKKIHDGDMRLMRTSFTNVTKTLEDWKEQKGPPLPVMPNAAKASTGNNATTDTQIAPPVQREITNIEDNWLSYVNLFIMAYKLDPAAQVSARDKIHKEQVEKAKQYREAKADDFAKIEAGLKAAGPNDKAERAKLQQRKKDLERRIHDLFVQMDERLKRLPTAAQTAGVDPEMKKNLDNQFAALAGPDHIAKSRKATRTIVKPPVKTDVEGDAKTDSAEPAKPTPTTAKADEPSTDESSKPEPDSAKDSEKSEKPAA